MFLPVQPAYLYVATQPSRFVLTEQIKFMHGPEQTRPKYLITIQFFRLVG